MNVTSIFKHPLNSGQEETELAQVPSGQTTSEELEQIEVVLHEIWLKIHCPLHLRESSGQEGTTGQNWDEETQDPSQHKVALQGKAFALHWSTEDAHETEEETEQGNSPGVQILETEVHWLGVVTQFPLGHKTGDVIGQGVLKLTYGLGKRRR